MIQLGIGGAALFVLYQLARLVVLKWSEGNMLQTKAIGDGFKSITDSHAQMIRDNLNGYNITSQMLNDHHSKVAGQIGNVRDLVIAVDAKVSAAMDLTPIRQQRPDLMQPIDKTLVAPNMLISNMPGALSTSLGASLGDDQDTPVQVPIPTPPTSLRQYNRPPTPVPMPAPERPLSPTAKSQAVPRKIGGEYSGAVKKPR